MTERIGMDPTDIWRQWYDAGSKMWTGALGSDGENFMDPWGLYRQWSEGVESMRGMGGNGSQATAAAWQKGMDATMEGWRKSAEATTEMMNVAPRWMEMLDQARENMMSVGQFPKDPLEFAVQWYNATSGPYSEFVQDAIEREEFLEQGSRFLQSYASFYKIFKRGSEEYLHNIQIPTRSDITRVASLVVTLEEKVDGIEDALEIMGDSQTASLTDEKIEALEKHLGKVEKKVEKTEDKLDKRLGKFEDKLAKRSDKAEDEMGKRIDGIEGKLDEISTSVDRPADTSATDGLGERINRVEGKLDGISSAVDRPADTSAVESLGGRMDEIEDKMDRILTLLEQPSDTSATDDLDERVDEVEGKHDQLLSSLGNLGPNADNAPTEEPPPAETNAPANVPEIRATDAARRKAADMSVDLAEVEGTGAGGQITVEDVRKKGES